MRQLRGLLVRTPVAVSSEWFNFWSPGSLLGWGGLPTRSRGGALSADGRGGCGGGVVVVAAGGLDANRDRWLGRRIVRVAAARRVPRSRAGAATSPHGVPAVRYLRVPAAHRHAPVRPCEIQAGQGIPAIIAADTGRGMAGPGPHEG